MRLIFLVFNLDMHEWLLATLDHACSTFLRDWPFLRGKKSLWPQYFRANYFFSTVGQRNLQILSPSSMNKCISHRDQKSADYHCHFEWQPAVFHQQHNFWLIATAVLWFWGTGWSINMTQRCIMLKIAPYHTSFLGLHEIQLPVSARRQSF